MLPIVERVKRQLIEEHSASLCLCLHHGGPIMTLHELPIAIVLATSSFTTLVHLRCRESLGFADVVTATCRSLLLE